MSCARCDSRVNVDGADLCVICQWEGATCRVDGCANDTGGPRDRDGFCADCADAIEEQDREHAMGDEQ